MRCVDATGREFVVWGCGILVSSGVGAGGSVSDRPTCDADDEGTHEDEDDDDDDDEDEDVERVTSRRTTAMATMKTWTTTTALDGIASRAVSARGRKGDARASGRARAAPREAPILPYRIGHGFDLHRLEAKTEFPELKLIIGGIEIAHDRGCVAHSDGDVLMHCVVDAITGALGLPDIGQLFPDTDPKWRGQKSDVFVKEAVRLMELAGYSIGNLDVTLIAQRPKISPHKERIRENMANVLGVHPTVVNVKAKTHEKVDSLGENRSIACHSVVMLIKN